VAKRAATSSKPEVEDYRHKGAKRKNNPPAQIAAEGTVPVIPKAKYAYNPHLPPVLRFDPTGSPDALPELLRAAGARKLSADEIKLLAEALRKEEPWLEWTGKREAKEFEVDPVALHIHERVAAQAILKIAARQDVERSLFGEEKESYHEAVQFYRHDIDWTNRVILGDSLAVMSSLAKREDLAGKVQMIYIDPPYGIRFASNFQPEIGRRDVKDKESDLTREPETVKAYRDTWELGIHSYLGYLRNRLVAARELLADSGSIFVQISDENLHRVRAIMDEVFGSSNFCGIISFQKTGSIAAHLLPSTVDFLLWYGKEISATKYRQLYDERRAGDTALERYDQILEPNGHLRRIESGEREGDREIVGERARLQSIFSSGASGTDQRFRFRKNEYLPKPNSHWKTSVAGLQRLAAAARVELQGERPNYLRLANDFNVIPLSDRWESVQIGMEGLYVVQTATRVIARCILMTTDPGDVVLDPTCGSGTTAYVAEQWGRRWITIDTSRVAISIARQRLLTAKFDYYELKPAANGGNGNSDSPSRGFVYKTVPHITLKSIAQNVALDPIFAKHEPILGQKLAEANAALAKVDDQTRHKLEAKLLAKQKAEGKKSITDADRRRWELPRKGAKWEHWTVPFDTDELYPPALAETVKAYRSAWRAKMDEVNAAIAATAEQEELVDQPRVVKGVVRVSGPFTVEAVQPPEMSLGEPLAVGNEENAKVIGGEPEEMQTFVMKPVEAGVGETAQDLVAYLEKMLRLLKGDGVGFPNNKRMQFSRLESLFQSGRSDVLHAEGRWSPAGYGNGAGADDGPNTVAVTFGPQYGPVTAAQVVEASRVAFRRGYEDLVVAGFSFDAAAYAEIQQHANPRLRVHIANIRPDVNPAMDGLLKERPGSQLFTVFGKPRTSIAGPNADGEYTVTMEGVDIYNPVDNSVTPTGAEKVAAWFIDGDYDGRTFCTTQAFFPDRNAWDKLAKALNGVNGLIDAERFEALSGTKSLPFPAGKHKRVAVKVIDPRGNEVMNVHELK